MEWAGAFGDLGTLIPFVIAYITLLDVDPSSLLFVIGLSQIVVGLYYKTPFPVQPMKAIGAIATTQAAQTLVITSNTVIAAGLVTGLLWLFLGMTGLATKLAKIIARPITLGIILGLGIAFILDGIERISTNWLIGATGLFGTLLLLTNKRFPAMIVLLLFGIIFSIVQEPSLLDELRNVKLNFQIPEFSWNKITINDIFIGTIFLALPQLPLTLGNAIIAIKEENNRLFPDRQITENKVAVSTGIMNTFSSMFSGIPLCHGAGGMAGHVRFGANTGGATVIIGTILLLLALLFSDSISMVFSVFPISILGVILFLTGAQLALGACDNGFKKYERFTMYTVAAATIWNVGIAFVYGFIVHWLLREKIIKL
jgi:MFS superfamily sulfate permease-like transporter